jgi:phospholipid/cholesterol/gamma-HCH transport system substrate-binding protein
LKKETGNKIKLGMLVSISMALFIVCIYFVGEKQQLFSSTFHISAIFKDIRGLQIGNNVRFSGINVGVVEEIEQITDSTVRVEMIIEEETRKFIKKNAVATIGTDGLMGNKIISISPGTADMQVISNKDIIQSFQPASTDELIIKLKEIADNASTITGDLAVIMGNIRSGNGTIGKILMDSAFAENIDAALINIKQGAGGFKKNMDAASQNVLLRGFIKKKKKESTEVKQ